MTVCHVTSARDTTTDRVIRELDKLGVESVRLNTERFPTQCRLSVSLDHAGTTGWLRSDSGRLAEIGRVGAIYYRRPLASNYDDYPRMSPESKRFAGRESGAGLYGFLNLLGARWVDHPDAVRRAERKAPQLETAKAVGFAMPRTLITNDRDAVADFAATLAGRPIIAKTIRSPLINPRTGQIAYTQLLNDEACERLGLLHLAPCIFQEYIDKRVEYRVTLVGDRVFCAAIHSQEVPEASIDWRQASYHAVRHEAATLPTVVQSQCLAFARAYGLQFAAFDLIERQDGAIVFIECNPVGEWAWIEATTGLPIAAAVAELLASFCTMQG